MLDLFLLDWKSKTGAFCLAVGCPFKKEKMSELPIKQSEQIGELVTALAVSQTEFKPFQKDKENPYTHSKYADLADVIAATQPSLAKNGLVIVQIPIQNNSEQEAGVYTMLAHKSGQFISTELFLPGTMKGKDGVTRFDAQSVGGAITYARRYTWQALVGVAAEEDDDGNTAAGRGEDRSSQSEQPRRSNPRPAPPVNQAAAKTGGSRPSQPKAVDAPPASIGAPQANEKPAEPAGLPSAADLDAVAKEQEIAASASSTTTSEFPTTVAEVTAGPKPDKTAFDAYVARAIALKQPLEKVGLKASKGLQTGAKIKNNLLASAGAKELADLTISQWETWLQIMEGLAKTDPAKAVEIIEGGKP